MIAITALFPMYARAKVQTTGTDLLSPPGHSTPRCKWMQFDGKPTSSPLGTTPVYAIAGGPYGMEGVIEGFSVFQPPTERRLRLVLDLRGCTSDQTFSLIALAWNPKAQPDAHALAAVDSPDAKSIVNRLAKVTAEWQKSGSLRQEAWTHIECNLTLPSGSRRVQVILHNPNKGQILMSTPRLLVGNQALPDAQAIAAARQELSSYISSVAHPDPHAVKTPTSG